MTPAVPHGYVLIPEPVFFTFVAIIAIAAFVELSFILIAWLNHREWGDS